MQMPRTDEAKQSVKLIDGQNGGRWVVDRWRQSLMAISTITRTANVESCSMERSGPKATWARSLLSSISAALPCRQNKWLPVATKSPTRGTSSTRPPARCAIPTSDLKLTASVRANLCCRRHFGINVFYDFDSIFADPPDDADWPERPCGKRRRTPRLMRYLAPTRSLRRTSAPLHQTAHRCQRQTSWRR